MGKTSAVVLAAGMSRRFGPENKLLQPLGGMTVLGKVLSTLAACNLAEVVVVTGHESNAIAAASEPFEVRLVHNPHYEEGMGRSIAAGVEACSPEHDYLIVLGDMPWITNESIFQIVSNARPNGIVVPTHEGREGNPVLFDSAYRQYLLWLTGDKGARSVIDQNRGNVSLVQVGEKLLDDLDQPNPGTRQKVTSPGAGICQPDYPEEHTANPQDAPGRTAAGLTATSRRQSDR